MKKAKTREVLIAGNWKMNHSIQETGAFFKTLGDRLTESECGKVKVAVFPPFLALQAALENVSTVSLPISIGAQNVHWEKSGAFTGEISGSQCQEIGISWALVGHSDRRQYFGETNETVKKRSESLLNQGLTIILCVGENQKERELDQMEKVLTQQLRAGLPSLEIISKNADKLIIAYEPVWAIGTGVNATPAQTEEAHHFIRKCVAETLSPQIAEKMLILYGGSVTPENIDSLLNCENVDGALVGGASLKAESFFQLLQAAKKRAQP